MTRAIGLVRYGGAMTFAERAIAQWIILSVLNFTLFRI